MSEASIEMSFKHRSKLVFALIVLFCGGGLANAADRPSVVLILSDDQGYTDYGFMGHPKIETPNLDKLARESALFRRGYVPIALCRPSLMTLITGLYSHQNKTTGNDPANTLANKAHAEKAGNLASTNPDRVRQLSALLNEGYVPDQRQVGKFTPVAPKVNRGRKPTRQPRKRGASFERKKQHNAETNASPM